MWWFYLIEEENENGDLVALCCDCKDDNMECKICGETLNSSESQLEQVKYLLYNFGKIEKCISCMVTTNEFILKPNVKNLQIGKDKYDNFN